MARRDASTDSFFGIDPLIGNVSDNEMAPGPFGAGFAIGNGFVTGDASAYYFTSEVSADGGLYASDGGTQPKDQAVFVTHRTNGVFDSNSLIAHDESFWIDNPVLSADELTMYVSTMAPNGSPRHIAVMTRSDKAVAFGPGVRLHELDSAEGEYPTRLSSDQCRLYITRFVDGQADGSSPPVRRDVGLRCRW